MGATCFIRVKTIVEKSNKVYAKKAGPSFRIN